MSTHQHPDGSQSVAQGNAFIFTQATLRSQMIQRPGNLARMQVDGIRTVLEVIHLFEDGDGNSQIVIIEAPDRRGIVEQDVRIDDV
jgi:hypothetical protein